MIFRNCTNLIRCLPLLRFDEFTKEDAADTPHEITHAPEALRYAIMSREPVFPKQSAPFTGSVYSFDKLKKDEGDYEDYIGY